MSPRKVTRKSAKSAKTSAARAKAYKGLSAEEVAAMKETLKERRTAASKEEAEEEVVAKIAEMKEPDRSMAKRLHEIIKKRAPGLSPKTWYGMPAYANTEGKVICFFQAAGKFKVRYATFGFQPDANLDEGNMWATSFALVKLAPAEEEKIIALLKKAVA
jgi:uncharacterized protein YdhG (YjbR/CyaY superfamily)